MASNHFISSIGERQVSEIETELAGSSQFGADLRFHGVVRDTENDRRISAIRYTSYGGMAEKELDAIGESMVEKYPGHRALVYHQIGEVPAGKASILIRVQTKHSAEGFEIIAEYLRRIKKTVPIWKEPIYVDNTI
jgi:molybdopterin synthase catalytic subunit